MKTEDTCKVTERIKTFEDACKELGEFHPFVEQYNILNQTSIKYTNKNDDIMAYMKLRVICAALNEGWEPKFTKGECRHYPWFYLYTKNEIEDMDEGEKNERCMINTGDYVTDCIGFAFADSATVPLFTFASIGAHLCLNNEALAVYCGKQFIDIWADFVLIRR